MGFIFVRVVLYPFNIIPSSLGAFNLRHSIYSWQRSRLIGIELYKGDAKLTIQTKLYTTEMFHFEVDLRGKEQHWGNIYH